MVVVVLLVNKNISSLKEEASPDQHEDHVPAVSPGSELSSLFAGGNQSRVKSMASRLLAKFEENASPPSATALRRQVCDYITFLLFVSMCIAGLYVDLTGVWQVLSLTLMRLSLLLYTDYSVEVSSTTAVELKSVGCCFLGLLFCFFLIDLHENVGRS